MVSLKSIANRIVSQVFAVSSLPEMTIDEYGNKEWRLNGLLHREDGPAIEYENGDKSWYMNGFLHRKDGPAIECENGSIYWYTNGKLHREDGPAVKNMGGDRFWYLNGHQIKYDHETWDQVVKENKINNIMEI